MNRLLGSVTGAQWMGGWELQPARGRPDVAIKQLLRLELFMRTIQWQKAKKMVEVISPHNS